MRLLNRVHKKEIPKSILIEHAIFGLAFEVRTMRDTPADKLDLPKALLHIEVELVRIGNGRVDENDLCY